MRYTRMLIPTLREVPGDAEVISHQLMLRGGYIRKLASGIYTYLPLGLRVLRNIEGIVREEMFKAGADELLLPMVMPAELWIETNRWNVYGKELLRFKDRHDRDFCIGPTHEEAITDLARHEIRSWREMPKNLFQIQTKFRDEIRPRFGLMRGREFIMKDAYSFDVDPAAARVTYDKMFEAYRNIFRRCGLQFRAVEAGTGAIGGSLSHEFQVLARSGEDAILACNACQYAANVELAEAYPPGVSPEVPKSGPKKKYKKVDTPDLKTVEEVAAFVKLTPDQCIKTLIFDTDKGPVAGMVRGDREIKETKLQRLLGCEWCHWADEETVRKATGAPSGFAGPVDLDIPVYADFEIAGMRDFLVGANMKDTHLVNVNLGDFVVKAFGDLRGAVSGEECPRCLKGKFQEFRGIEVGQVFYLGTKYSESMKALYLDKNGKSQPIEMGCYGIGIGRTAAAAIEQNHDDRGIIWPLPIAPFKVEIVTMNNDTVVCETAEKIYDNLRAAGIEVLYDDRDERGGVKLTDAELIGIPHFLIIGAKGLKEGKVELKNRATGEIEKVSLEGVLALVREKLSV